MKTMKKNKRKLLTVISIVFIVLLFYQFQCYFAPDSCWYYYMSLMFDKTADFKDWLTIRGFVYPLYLFFITKIFGRTTFGVTTSLFLSYIGFIFLSIKLVNKVVEKKSWIICFLYAFLIVLNPIIMGYSHCVLTESLTVLLAMFGVCLSYQYYFIEKNTNIIIKIIYVLLCAILITVMWFLKQPYMLIIFFMYFISIVAKVINKERIFNIIYGLITVVVSGVFLFSTLLIWNSILEKNKLNNATEQYMSVALMDGIKNYYKIDEVDCSKSYVKKLDLSERKQNEIISNNCNNIVVYNVYNLNNMKVSKEVLFHKKKVSTVDTLLFMIEQFFKHPIIILKNTYNNYMATINLHSTQYINGIMIVGTKLMNYENENTSLAKYIMTTHKEYWWHFYNGSYDKLKKEYKYINMMGQYERDIKIPTFIEKTYDIMYKPSSFLFKILLLITPIEFIFYLIKFVKNKKETINILFMIVFGSSFVHILFHAVTGATIDRYAYICYPVVLIMFIIQIQLLLKIVNYKRN